MATRDEDYETAAGGDLPWLEPTELEYESGGGFLSGRAVVIGGLTIAAVIAILAFLAWQYGGDGIEVPEGGQVPLVAAPEGPYRIAPDDPGGMALPEDELGIHAVAEGDALPGEVATDALPEVPVPVVPPVGTGSADGPPRDLVAEAQAAAEPPPSAAPPAAPRAPEADLPTSSTGVASVQLGAFSTPAKANAVWKTLSGRYAYLSGLEKSVEAVAVNGDTLWRLRASGVDGRAAANDLCGRLKVAGEQCVVP